MSLSTTFETKKVYSLSTLLILSYILIRVAFIFPRFYYEQTHATISWDVFGYYLYLPAAFIYDDLGELGFIEEIMNTYRPSGDFHQATRLENDKYIMKYPIGMAVAYLPWFVIAHFSAGILAYPQDGFSIPYQFWIHIGCIIYAIIGLFLLRHLLLRYFKDHIVAITLAILILATNYLNYVAIDSAYTHNFLFTLFVVVLWLSQKWHERPHPFTAFGLGLTIGLATIVRPTELMISLIPVFWGIYDRQSLQDKISLLLSRWKDVLILAIGVILMGFVQLTYWKIYSGQWLFYSYGEFGFDWLSPHLWSGIFSYQKGWLLYTPVMILALIGLPFLYQQQKHIFWAIFFFFLINLYVVFSWEVWWYGGGLGARPLVQSYALLTFALGAYLTYAWNNTWLKVITIAFIVFCIDINLVMHWQSHAPNGGWRAEGLTKLYYWKILGNTNPDKADKKYLDLKRELKRKDRMNVRTIHQNDFEQDSLFGISTQYAHSGKQSFQVNKQTPFSPAFKISFGKLAPAPGSWVGVKAKIFFTYMVWNEYEMAQFVTEYTRPDKGPYSRRVKLQRLTDPWTWHEVTYEVRLPKTFRSEDTLQVFVWNPGATGEVFVDDVEVVLYEPR